MKINMGSQIFRDVMIPLLWGSRAVVQDKQGRLSVIDLSGKEARLEIVGDRPAPGTEFKPTIDGVTILENGKELYNYNPESKVLRSISLSLPECEIGPWQIRVGTNTFSGNMVSGYGVGIAVSEQGIGMGVPLPKNLAKLVVK